MASRAIMANSLPAMRPRALRAECRRVGPDAVAANIGDAAIEDFEIGGAFFSRMPPVELLRLAR